MVTLRMLEAKPAAARKGADLFGCAYGPDGAFVLSAGWDGQLRLWEASTGVEAGALRAGPKPLACCAASPDGLRWLAGSIEGVLTIHDPVARTLVASIAAHTRPVSAICFSPDGDQLATSSWDRQVALRKVGKEREARALNGHKDIVAGCRFTGDGAQLLSWSYDGTLRLWDAASGREESLLRGHDDRVTAAAPSPDGRWVVSGGRDGAVHLWDLSSGASVRSLRRPAEIRACLFLLDGASAVAVDAAGGVALLSTPDLKVLCEVQTGAKPQAADLSPAGAELALACEDGRVRFLAVDGQEGSALVVTAVRRTRPAPGVLGLLMGKARTSHTYEYVCPACRRAGESGSLPSQAFPCPGCRRTLRVSGRVRQLQEN